MKNETIIQYFEWYLDTTGVDGMRLDAVKHINVEFFHQWLGRMRMDCGVRII